MPPADDHTSKTNIIYSVILLFAFGIGHILVIVTAGTLTKKVQQYLNWTEKSKASTYIKRICGALVILGGVYMIYNIYPMTIIMFVPDVRLVSPLYESSTRRVVDLTPFAEMPYHDKQPLFW